MEWIPDIDKEQIRSTSYFDNEKNIRFDPTCYEQRYMYVIRILDHPMLRDHIKNVVEFGPSEMKFFILMKSLKHLEKVALVDVDRETLDRFQDRIKPLLCDHLNRREKPFKAEIYEGSVSKLHRCLVNCDAVVAVELIEHVYPDVIEEIPYNVFSFIRPKIAVFTTPNSEFNVLFPGLVGFRHDDHKFEWTREQFQDWSHNICLRFPDYVVQFHGVGRGPEGNEHLGCVSQLALFIRKDILNMESEIKDPQPEIDPTQLDEFDSNYKLVRSEDYPFFCDTRSRAELVFDEAEYHLRRLKNCEDDYYICETQKYEIPLEKLAIHTFKITESVEELRKALEEKYQIVDDKVIVESDVEEDEDDDFY